MSSSEEIRMAIWIATLTPTIGIVLYGFLYSYGLEDFNPVSNKKHHK